MRAFKKSLLIMMIIVFYPLLAFSAVQNAQSIVVAVMSEDISVRIGFDLSGPGASGITATTTENSIILHAPQSGFSNDLIEMVVFADNMQICSVKLYCQSYFGKACLKNSVSIENFGAEKGTNALIIPWNENASEVKINLLLKKSESGEYYCSSNQ